MQQLDLLFFSPAYVLYLQAVFLLASFISFRDLVHKSVLMQMYFRHKHSNLKNLIWGYLCKEKFMNQQLDPN